MILNLGDGFNIFTSTIFEEALCKTDKIIFLSSPPRKFDTLSVLRSALCTSLLDRISLQNTILNAFGGSEFDYAIQIFLNDGFVRKSFGQSLYDFLQAFSIGISAFALASTFPAVPFVTAALQSIVGSASWAAVKSALEALNSLSMDGDSPTSSRQVQRTFDCCMQAVEVTQKNRDRLAESAATGMVGVAHRHRGQPEKAIEYYRRASDISREVGDWHGAATWLRNAGNTYTDLKQPELSKVFYISSLAISRIVGDYHGEINSLEKQERVYYSLNQAEQALECRTLSSAIEQGFISGEQRFNETLSFFKGVKFSDTREALHQPLLKIHVPSDTKPVTNETNTAPFNPTVLESYQPGLFTQEKQGVQNYSKPPVTQKTLDQQAQPNYLPSRIYSNKNRTLELWSNDPTKQKVIPPSVTPELRQPISNQGQTHVLNKILTEQDLSRLTPEQSAKLSIQPSRKFLNSL